MREGFVSRFNLSKFYAMLAFVERAERAGDFPLKFRGVNDVKLGRMAVGQPLETKQQHLLGQRTGDFPVAVPVHHECWAAVIGRAQRGGKGQGE